MWVYLMDIMLSKTVHALHGAMCIQDPAELIYDMRRQENGCARQCVGALGVIKSSLSLSLVVGYTFYESQEQLAHFPMSTSAL